MELSSQKESYTPRPNLKNAMIPKISGSIITSLFFTLFIFLYLYSLRESNYFSLAAAVTISVIIFLLIAAIPVFIRYMNLINTEYRFFHDRIEYFEDWLTINRHSIPYEKITDVVMRKTIWDRLFDTATIGLLTSGHYTGPIFMPYINEPEKVYHVLQKIVIQKGRR